MRTFSTLLIVLSFVFAGIGIAASSYDPPCGTPPCGQGQPTDVSTEVVATATRDDSGCGGPGHPCTLPTNNATQAADPCLLPSGERNQHCDEATATQSAPPTLQATVTKIVTATLEQITATFTPVATQTAAVTATSTTTLAPGETPVSTQTATATFTPDPASTGTPEPVDGTEQPVKPGAADASVFTLLSMATGIPGVFLKLIGGKKKKEK